MAKGIGLVGWLVAGGVAALGIAALTSHPSQTEGKPPPWWPAGLPFATKPANWPANAAWPPSPDSPPPPNWNPTAPAQA